MSLVVYRAIEQGTTAGDIRFEAWAVQLGASMFVGQYRHLKTNASFAVKVHAGLSEIGTVVTWRKTYLASIFVTPGLVNRTAGPFCALS